MASGLGRHGDLSLGLSHPLICPGVSSRHACNSPRRLFGAQRDEHAAEDEEERGPVEAEDDELLRLAEEEAEALKSERINGYAPGTIFMHNINRHSNEFSLILSVTFFVCQFL